jgi:hypothetical protein
MFLKRPRPGNPAPLPATRGRWLRAPPARLAARKQHFLHALARPRAGEDDVEVATGLEADEPDHALGKVDDFHRLTHVEHIDREVRAHDWRR